MPEGPIIDTHVHFWDRKAVPISWNRGLEIDRPFLPAALDTARADVAVEASVFVEADVDPGAHLAEVDWVTGLAARDPRIRAIVAHVPLETASAAADIEALAERPLVRGVRRLIQTADAEALCGNAAFRDGLRRLAAHDLHFEICILHHQLGPVIDMVRALPDVRFVLDHIAKPGIKAGLTQPWWTRMAELAALPNVVCKLSGVATEANHAAWTEDDIRPYIDRTIEVFGPARLMFGSDWPVMTLAIDYPEWVAILDRALAGLSAEERASVFADNARTAYRL